MQPSNFLRRKFYSHITFFTGKSCPFTVKQGSQVRKTKKFDFTELILQLFVDNMVEVSSKIDRSD